MPSEMKSSCCPAINFLASLAIYAWLHLPHRSPHLWSDVLSQFVLQFLPNYLQLHYNTEDYC
jgi:hypothetical protein